MLVVNYNGNKPVSDYFKFSVQGNNNADIVRFVIQKKQGNIDLTNENFTIYAKCQTPDQDFADKVALSTPQEVGNNLFIDWVLEAKHTANKQLQVSLSFEDLQSETVWQTQLFTMTINNGVDVAGSIENTYPDVLQDLQAQIDEIPNVKNAPDGTVDKVLGLNEDGELVKGNVSSGGGGVSEVEIKRVYLTYDHKKSIKLNTLGCAVQEDDGYKAFVNDSTHIWVNFETTIISEKMEQEIENERFVIRLDYPIKKHNDTKVGNDSFKATKAVNQRDCGAGYRGYAYSFNEINTSKKSVLLKSLIYVNSNDIKTNAYGEKYIHKKITLFDFVNSLCQLRNESRKEVIEMIPITLKNVRNGGEYASLYDGYLDEVFCCGIPNNCQNGMGNNDTLFAGKSVNKIFEGYKTYFGSDVQNKTSKKLNPAFNCYFLVICNEVEYGEKVSIYSPYYISKPNCPKEFENYNINYIAIKNENAPLEQKGTKKLYMSAKPRCAILNDNFEEAENAFLRTYPQSTQQLKVMCKYMYSDSVSIVAPIFRVIFTPK